MSEPPPIIDPNSARLYAIIARKVRRAIVFRRGPAKKTRLIVWNLEDDMMFAGQWFQGRVYERRCDLSPDARWLAYYAATYRKPYYSWTAIARPPYFTALAMWPKHDAWGGGGLFDDALALRLNHRADQRKAILWRGTPLPSRFHVREFGAHPGSGEDDPIMSERLTRDGWTFPTARGRKVQKSGRISLVLDPPAIRTLQLTRGRVRALTLRVLMHGWHEKGGRWYVETADLVDAKGRTIRDFGRIDWIDADHNGDILLAREGKLERLPRANFARDLPPREIANLNDMHFERIVSPAWARTWSASEPDH